MADPFEKKGEGETPRSEAPSRTESGRVEDASGKLEASAGGASLDGQVQRVAGDVPVADDGKGAPVILAKADATAGTEAEGDRSAPESVGRKPVKDPFWVSDYVIGRIAEKPINVLVADDISDLRNVIIEVLGMTGLSRDHILEVGTIDEAFDGVMACMEDERTRIDWVLSDIHIGDSDGGVTLMETLRGIKGDQPRPYLTAMGDLEHGSPVIERILKSADGYIVKGETDAFSATLLGAFEKAVRYSEQVGVSADKPKVQMGESLSSEAEGKGPASNPGPKSASPETVTWFERLGIMKDLRKDESASDPSRLTNQMVAVFDLDGTLAKPFTMGRLVEFLTEPSEKGHDSPLIELLSDLPQNRRDENLRNSRQLLDTFKAWFDKTYKGSYEGFIRESDRLFAGMLRGLRANEVFKKCQKWCKEDASHHLYSYARPLIRMVKHIGVVPTLITGTPAEAVAGFRQELEIEDRCHPLELSTNPETGRYMELKYETGLAKSKNEVIRKIIKSGNRIVLSAGDQKTDSPLHEASLFREQDSFSGLACYLGTNREDIQGFSQHVERRWMLHIDHTELTTFSILEMIVERLDAIAQLKENQSVMTVGFREKVQNLIQDRESIRQFIVSEKDEG